MRPDWLKHFEAISQVFDLEDTSAKPAMWQMVQAVAFYISATPQYIGPSLTGNDKTSRWKAIAASIYMNGRNALRCSRFISFLKCKIALLCVLDMEVWKVVSSHFPGSQKVYKIYLVILMLSLQVSNCRIAIIHKKTLLKDGVEEASFSSLILKVLVFRYSDLESKGILFLWGVNLLT